MVQLSFAFDSEIVLRSGHDSAIHWDCDRSGGAVDDVVPGRTHLAGFLVTIVKSTPHSATSHGVSGLSIRATEFARMNFRAGRQHDYDCNQYNAHRDLFPFQRAQLDLYVENDI